MMTVQQTIRVLIICVMMCAAWVFVEMMLTVEYVIIVQCVAVLQGPQEILHVDVMQSSPKGLYLLLLQYQRLDHLKMKLQ